MAGILSSLVGSGVYLYMFSAFSGLGQRNIVKLAVTFVLLLITNVFVPVSGPLNAFVYYTIIALIFISIFKVKYYATAIYMFIMFVIHYSSAMISTNVLIYASRELVDYRLALKTENMLYIAIFAAIACLMVYTAHRALRSLVRYFEHIKDMQRNLYILNSVLFLAFFIYLRLQILTGTKVVALQGEGIRWLQMVQFASFVMVFLWLAFTLNKHRILYTREMGQRNWQTIVDLVSNAKMSRQPLSLIYAEFPYYDEFVKRYGARKGSQIMDVVQSTARNSVGGVVIRVRQNALLLVLENCEEYRALQQKDDFLKDYQSKVAGISDPNVGRLLLGVSKFDPMVHSDYRSFMYSAQERAYS